MHAHFILVFIQLEKQQTVENHLGLQIYSFTKRFIGAFCSRVRILDRKRFPIRRDDIVSASQDGTTSYFNQ